ncbi:hypothetical protein OSSY52_21390 [Tepiditoga spiralis]|uniref:Nucleotide pyrophosphohydrolase n=1 Tax=Tepiditoga spiralis TaxID=2108365 RepID=A0A7G1G611_9BACT|nr:nucleotide pyrophosphohydrolase [Tepiditoga spiralis]BBE31998.1 hypothetical protein OSSY52_21390 [Tepiditoga spiralis]
MDLKISELKDMSYKIWEKNKDKWSPLNPQEARNTFLWMIEEIGETIQILKKRGESEIMENTFVREKFIEEMSDIIFYFTKIMLSYNISAEEFSKIYIKKFEKNMIRDYEKEHMNMFKD